MIKENTEGVHWSSRIVFSLENTSANKWGIFSSCKVTSCYLEPHITAEKSEIRFVTLDDEKEILYRINPDDIIGVDLTVGDTRELCLKNCVINCNDKPTTMNIYCYPKGKMHRTPKHYKLRMLPESKDSNCICACVKGIRTLANLNHNFHNAEKSESSDIIKSKKYLVVVNPYSGLKKGKDIYEQKIHPMMEQAGLDHDLFMTQYAGHGKERMKMVTEKEMTTGTYSDISSYDAIIAVGGDGILSEIINGIEERSDSHSIFGQKKFGIVGAGTSNGLAKSLLHASNETYSELESVYLICKGFHHSVDLSTYKTYNNSYRGFLSFSYAIVADVDIESESLRCLGSLRQDIYALWRMIFLRRYPCRFSYLPSDTKMPKEKIVPPLDESLKENENWVTIEDDFILFWPGQVSHAAYNSCNSPKSKLNDGIFRVLLIRKSSNVSRFDLLRMFLEMEEGTHEESFPQYCEVYECVSWRLEPLLSIGGPIRSSFNDLDGEVIESGPVQAVINGSIQMFYRDQK